MIFTIGDIIAILTLAATVAIPFVVAIWQFKRSNPKNLAAISICDNFFAEIVPEYVNFKTELKRDEMSCLNSIQTNADNTQLLFPFTTDSDEIKKLATLDESYPLLEKAMLLFNKLDSFSTHIMNLSKEEQLYAKTLARNAFVDIINQLSGIYNIITFVRENDYVNLRHLYYLWK